MGVDRDGLRKQIENWVSIFPSQKMVGRLPFTPRVKRSLQLAVREAKVLHHACVGAEHIFMGLLLEGDGVAGRVEESWSQCYGDAGRNSEGIEPDRELNRRKTSTIDGLRRLRGRQRKQRKNQEQGFRELQLNV